MAVFILIVLLDRLATNKVVITTIFVASLSVFFQIVGVVIDVFVVSDLLVSRGRFVFLFSFPCCDGYCSWFCRFSRLLGTCRSLRRRCPHWRLLYHSCYWSGHYTRFGCRHRNFCLIFSDLCNSLCCRHPLCSAWACIQRYPRHWLRLRCRAFRIAVLNCSFSCRLCGVTLPNLAEVSECSLALLRTTSKAIYYVIYKLNPGLGTSIIVIADYVWSRSLLNASCLLVFSA